MTTPTIAAQANDLGERCSIVIGTVGYVPRNMYHSVFSDQPWLKLRPQFSTDPTAQYINNDKALTMRDYDRFSRVVMSDYRHGSGQIAFDPSDTADQRRFYDSTGVVVSKEGQFSLAHQMSSMYAGTTGSNTHNIPILGVEGLLYIGVNGAVRYSATWSGAPTSAATSSTPATADVTCLATDGTNIYAGVNAVGINKFAYNSSSAGTSWNTTSSGMLRLIYANRRLYGIDESNLYEFALASGTGTTDFTVPTGWWFQDLCALDGGAIDAPIIVMGHSQTSTVTDRGTKTTTWYWDGVTIHDYVSFPSGFTGKKMIQYLGVIYVFGAQSNPDGTSSAATYAIVGGNLSFIGYLGNEQSNGNPTANAVYLSSTTDTAWGMDASGHSVYFSVNAGSSQEVWVYDIVNGGLSRLVQFATSASMNACEVAMYAGQPWVTVCDQATNVGLYGFASTFLSTGNLTMSNLNIGQPWTKNVWANLETTFSPLAAGEAISVAYSTDNGTTFTTTDVNGAAMTVTTLGATSANFLISNSSASTITSYIRPKVTLTAGTSNLTTPAFYTLSVKAVPQNAAGNVLECYLACADAERMPNNQPDWQGLSGGERMYNIVNLYNLQALVKVIYLAPGATRAKNPVTISAIIDSYEISFYPPSNVRPGAGPPMGVEGDIHVVLREVRVT